MNVRKDIDLSRPPTDAQIDLLNALTQKPITPDEDCPELSAAQLAMFRRISEENHDERCKQSVTLRLSPQALRKARSLGKGYTSVLSRILESALNNPDVIRRNL